MLKFLHLSFLCDRQGTVRGAVLYEDRSCCLENGTICLPNAAMHPTDANGIETEKTLIRLLLKEQFDLGPHCLLRHSHPNS